MTLRKQVIKLAYDNPELRPTLLPLLHEAGRLDPRVKRDELAKKLDKLRQQMEWLHVPSPESGAAMDFPRKYKPKAEKAMKLLADIEKLIGRVEASMNKMPF